MNRARTFPSSKQTRHGFALSDLLVVAVALVLLLAVVLPHLAQAAAVADKRVQCAGNLRQIAMASLVYATADRGGKFPRLYYNADTAEKPALYTGAKSAASFDLKGDVPGGPVANDVTGAVFLLLKNTDLKPDALVCPGSAGKKFVGDPKNFANFTAAGNLTYSYTNPYPLKSAVMNGWRLSSTNGPTDPLFADINPGDTAKGGPSKVAPNSPAAEMKLANSPNHEGAGQNVAYCDGHVEFATTPFAGNKNDRRAWADNIYTNMKDVDAKTGKGGVVLGGSVDFGDAVMLPTAQDAPAAK